MTMTHKEFEFVIEYIEEHIGLRVKEKGYKEEEKQYYIWIRDDVDPEMYGRDLKKLSEFLKKLEEIKGVDYEDDSYANISYNNVIYSIRDLEADTEYINEWINSYYTDYVFIDVTIYIDKEAISKVVDIIKKELIKNV